MKEILWRHQQSSFMQSELIKLLMFVVKVILKLEMVRESGPYRCDFLASTFTANWKSGPSSFLSSSHSAIRSGEPLIYSNRRLCWSLCCGGCCNESALCGILNFMEAFHLSVMKISSGMLKLAGLLQTQVW